MISLAARDIRHNWAKFLLTGIGLGLLIGITLTMAGVFRGMVDDAQALLENSGADLWVVQKDTQGPYAESSSLKDDILRGVAGMPGVSQAANITYFTMQVSQLKAQGAQNKQETRSMVVGIEPGMPLLPGQPTHLVDGRHLNQSHYEAVVDLKTGFHVGDQLQIRRQVYRVVGVTQRMVSSGGDPMVFIPLKDAQEAQFLKDNDAIVNDRLRTSLNPSFNRPSVPGLLESVQNLQTSSRNVNAVLVRIAPGWDPNLVAEPIRRWKHLTVYTRADMEEILVKKLIATSAKQIGMFLVILAVVSAAIVAFIIYTMTLGKIREIAVLKLIGTQNLTIAWMILQQALGLGVIGFVVGKISATIWAPIFPKFVLLLNQDAVLGFALTMLICALASTLAIRAALSVDPAQAIG